MTKEEIEQKYNPGYSWLGRSLSNYKKQQSHVAENKGVLRELQNAKTLTDARRIVYGSKGKS